MKTKMFLALSARFLMTTMMTTMMMTSLACSSGGSGGAPAAKSEAEVFESGLNGKPQVENSLYAGSVALDFTDNGKTTTHPAGILVLRMSNEGVPLRLNIALQMMDPDSGKVQLEADYTMMILENTLLKDGRPIGRIGAESILIEDSQWTYKIHKTIAPDGKTPMLKVEARSEHGGQTAVYRADLARANPVQTSRK